MTDGQNISDNNEHFQFYLFLKNVLNVIIGQSTFKSSRNVSQFYSSVKDADLDTYLRFEAPKQDM